MRSARILFAATAAAGTLALAAPGAYAITAGDWDKEDSAHSRDHDKPHGGMHTGSGALSLVDADDWSKDEQGKKDEHAKKDEHGKKEHDKPHGGVHTGGGALTAVSGDEWSKEHDKGGKHEKDHDKPKGGMHTGSGALSVVNADDWSKDKEKEKEEGGWSKENQKEEGGSQHEKPKGGMHTGGGGLANSGTSLTGALVLAGGAAAFVLYRRKQGSAAA
ncbi:hypothetical protein MBT42_34965 [Streptomyces sp. MBT42]|uniref:hypothetical protein n=1 Tax=Streptomyces sp. MBT42 TaxID=1488373 RepID=UPI001E4E55C0|nr:hypothetical protein [Streptomyces sp. MBT42]MCD2468737.1 hypothetical protein [Streptomyces sp. MBT42]